MAPATAWRFAPLPTATASAAEDRRIAHVQALVVDERDADEDGGGTLSWLRRLCSAAARELPAFGAGVSVMTEDGLRGTAAASDPQCEVLEDLQFTLGQGPCMDAFASRRAVLEPDLAVTARWPEYTPEAHARGVRAVFAFPLQVGSGRLGVLDVYRDAPGALPPAAVDLAMTFADTATSMLLAGDAGRREQPGGDLDGIMSSRLELYQAQGMVSVQLGQSVDVAMARLRAYAFAHDQPIVAVAHDVLARTLVFDRDD